MQIKEIPEFNFRGIKRIEIPYADKDFRDAEDKGASILNKYMQRILNTHKENAKKERYLYEYFLGVQDIRLKERIYQKDAKNNNLISQNHAHRQVQFKVDFLTSEQKEYTHKSDVSTDDLKYLDRYNTSVDYFAKQRNMFFWVYATGVGITAIEPRTDIIDANGVYADKSKGYDVENDAPYSFESLNPTENFVVYSSGRNKEPLFCVSVADVDIGENGVIKLAYKIMIETKYAYFECKTTTSYGGFKAVEFKSPKILHQLPFDEYSMSDDRMGLVELNKDSFNAINSLLSSVEDMVIDNANMLFVFKNTDISQTQIDEMKSHGALVISDAQGAKQGTQADVKTITIEIPFDGFIQYTESLLVPSYDIAGVPLASGQVTSGGDTGQARLLGGGWNNAYISINGEIVSFKKTDYSVLRKMITICATVPKCPINELSASQIDIKYKINQNDNLLIKAQSLYQLWQSNFPYEEAVKAVGLFSDSVTVAKKWQEKDEKAKSQTNETQNEENKNAVTA